MTCHIQNPKEYTRGERVTMRERERRIHRTNSEDSWGGGGHQSRAYCLYCLFYHELPEIKNCSPQNAIPSRLLWVSLALHDYFGSVWPSSGVFSSIFYFLNNSFLWKSLDYHSGIFVPVLSVSTHSCLPPK